MDKLWLRSRLLQHVHFSRHRLTSGSGPKISHPNEEGLEDLGVKLENEFSSLREQYRTPKHPVVLAHGLFGFNELHLLGKYVPGIQYWRGIRDALAAKDVEVIITEVPPAGSIEARAAVLAEQIADKAGGKTVNIIAHSMGGLDSRYMISQLKPSNVKVLSLTTIATPHRGSAMADFVFDRMGVARVPRLYKKLDHMGVDTGAFSQLMREYMAERFNPKTPNSPEVRYYSYGASLEPRKWTIFRLSHGIIKKMEGAANDGLVRYVTSHIT
jgi:triacylglycerol lipase